MQGVCRCPRAMRSADGDEAVLLLLVLVERHGAHAAAGLAYEHLVLLRVLVLVPAQVCQLPASAVLKVDGVRGIFRLTCVKVIGCSGLLPPGTHTPT